MESRRYDFSDLTIAAYNILQGVLTRLHDLVVSDNDDVCLGAARSLGVLGHPSSQTALFRAMGARSDLVDRLIETTARFRTPAVLQCFSDLLFRPTSLALKARILELIGDFTEPDVMSVYRQFFTVAEPELREGVARGLGRQKLTAAEAESMLEHLLVDQHRNVVTQALVSLRSVGNENTLQVIERTLDTFRDPYVRSAALGTLGVLSMGRSRDLIRKFLKDTDARIRSSAVEALGHHLASDPETIRELMPFLRDENNRVRANAIVALYSYARDESLEALRSLLQSPRKYYRASAAFCIGEIQYPEVMDRVLPLINTEPEQEVFERALDAIGKITKPSLKPFLMRLAAHPHNALRLRVIETLQRMATVDDLYTFNELLRHEAVPAVKAQIIRAVGAHSNEDNYTPLLEYLRDKVPLLVMAAMDALAMVQQSPAIPLVAPLIGHADPDIRACAAKTLFLLGETSIATELEGQLVLQDTKFVTATIGAIEDVFGQVRDLRTRKPRLLLHSLDRHFAALQESDIERIRRGLVTTTAGSVVDSQSDRSTSHETLFAELLAEILPLEAGRPVPKLAQFARQNPKDYVAGYLDAVYNHPADLRELSDEVVATFRHEHFLPGLFVALEQMKRGGDVRRLMAHYLEMASVEIRILLEFINRAMRYVNEKSDRKALKMLDFLFHYLRLSPDIHNRFGSFYLQQKDYDLAFNHLQKAYAQSPANLDLLLKLSGAATRLGKLTVGEVLARAVYTATTAGSPLHQRAEGMLNIIVELRKGANPDRHVAISPAPRPPSTDTEEEDSRPTPPTSEAQPHDPDISVSDLAFSTAPTAHPMAIEVSSVLPLALSEDDDVLDVDDMVAAMGDEPVRTGPTGDEPFDIDEALAGLDDD